MDTIKNFVNIFLSIYMLYGMWTKMLLFSAIGIETSAVKPFS